MELKSKEMQALQRVWKSLAFGLVLSVSGLALSAAAETPKTAKLMLSGTGPDDAVAWDFTVDGGMRAGEKAKIPVPSNWQTQGFGHYQYGYDKGPRASDHGTYHRSFDVPADWKGKNIRIVFDGVMTDTLVKVNGTVVGPVHQGGFNRFSYDITKLIKPGAANDVVVEVSEASAAPLTDIAERRGDYWVFGGIYRPVWLEAAPPESVSHLAIDARADGNLSADVSLRIDIPPRTAGTVTKVVGQVVTRDGQPVGAPFSVAIPAGGAGTVRLTGHVDKPALWSAETPNLYNLDVTLYAGDTAVHQVRQRFGFRTFEVREGDGLYLNGQRIMLKGVNRHSFRPDTGRALTTKDAYDDARLIKSMNMNAMRASHYDPDEAFLEAADELGLYIVDELSGWQNAQGTAEGRILVRELVERDVNHPSVVIWSNGNEGGWNRELDGDFSLYDPQKRTVIHPWDPFGGIDTKHYPRYADLTKRLSGTMLVMPTEMLHGLFDGGGGAGLDDYWKAMTTSKNGAGGFIWNLADEGVKRVDQGGRIDVFGTFAPDGLVGPHFEKEPSYFTVRDVWSPVQVDTPKIDASFTGKVTVHNAYDFNSLSDVKFKWEWLRFPAANARTTDATVLAGGTIDGPAVAPHADGELTLPLAKGWQAADALRLTATKGDETVLSWVWPTSAKAAPLVTTRAGTPKVERAGTAVTLSAGPVSATFDPATGLLTALTRNGQSQAIANGPRLVLARPKDKADPTWTTLTDAGNGVYTPPQTGLANMATVDLGLVETDGWAGFRLEISADGTHWKPVYDGARVARDGQTYSFPPQIVKAVRVTNLSGVRQTPKVVSVKLAYESARFALPAAKPVTITTGTGKDANGKATAWLEAPNAGGLDTVRWTLAEDGTLSLDYAYSLNGPMQYHGIGFNRPLGDVASVRALVRGPEPVWQNRLRGPLLGVYDIASHDAKAALRPETAGYFADPRWLKLNAGSQALTIVTEGAPFVQVGARLEDHPTTTADFPADDIGFLQAIPGMGSKGQTADGTGPQGQPALAAGAYRGRLVFAF